MASISSSSTRLLALLSRYESFLEQLANEINLHVDCQLDPSIINASPGPFQVALLQLFIGIKF